MKKILSITAMVLAGISVAALVERIDGARRDTNLSSALRIHLVTRLMEGGALRGSAAEQD